MIRKYSHWIEIWQADPHKNVNQESVMRTIDEAEKDPFNQNSNVLSPYLPLVKELRNPPTRLAWAKAVTEHDWPAYEVKEILHRVALAGATP